MNLWIRLIWLLIRAQFAPRLILTDEPSRLKLRVLPNDLDLSGHMNNGRYLAVMDLGRIDLLLRSGLWRACWEKGWTPIANSVAIRFRRELLPFQAYELVTRVVAWTDRGIVIEQTFLLAKGRRAGEVAARALVRGGLYDRRTRAFVDPSQLAADAGLDVGELAPNGALVEDRTDIDAFLAADKVLLPLRKY